MYLLIIIVLAAAEELAGEGCSPLPKGNFGTLRYYPPFERDGKYDDGTHVRLYCHGYGSTAPDGPSESECINGEWVPSLGACPSSECEFGDQEKARGYSEMTKPNDTTTVSHRQTATFKCGDDSHEFLCFAGEWQPLDQKKSRCVHCDPYKHTDEHGSYTYSKKLRSDGRYPVGTKVNLHCPLNLVIGKTTSICSSGIWAGTLGRCGLNCTHESVTGLRYLGIRVDGELSKDGAPHDSLVELDCNGETHLHHCYNGTMTSVNGEKCGNCIKEDILKLGYTELQNGDNTVDGVTLDGTPMNLRCFNESHHYRCANGVLQPLSASSVMCGCSSPPKAQNEEFRFSSPALIGKLENGVVVRVPDSNGNYENGTTVTVSCTNGEVIPGNNQSTCIAGRWKPPVRCPRMCDLNELSGKRRYRPAKLVGPRTTGRWQVHGGNATGVCRYGQYHQYSWTHSFTCDDGVWEPWNQMCRT